MYLDWSLDNTGFDFASNEIGLDSHGIASSLDWKANRPHLNLEDSLIRMRENEVERLKPT